MIQFIADSTTIRSEVKDPNRQLHLIVLEGRNMERLSMEQDPYVEIEMIGKAKQVVKTSPDTNGNPRCYWREELQITLPEDYATRSDMALKVSVRDGKNRSNRLIGSCNIALKPNVMNSAHIEDQWYELHSTRSPKPAGEIRLKFKRGPFDKVATMINSGKLLSKLKKLKVIKAQ